MGGQLDVSAYYAAPKDEATKDWVMQQTMFRVKDPKRSLDFYTKVLGMQLITVGDFPQWGFTVFFVGYPPEKDLGPVPENDADKFAYCMKVPGCVELTWNHGSEAEDADRVYNTGNADSTGSKDGEAVKGGFGHIGITVPDVYAACQRFKDMGAEFTKSPNAGGMKGLAFVKDPDGYLVEVLPLGKGFPFPTQDTDCCGVSLSGGEGYADNSKKK
uniref:lactoylglutathione lyase n=1 Tax=Spumella elongata TaxID=89044 RepID=A0A7S3MI45_9STRA